MAKKKKPIDWKNRIVEYGEMPANQYLAHELNARRHPGKQREALIGSLNEVGWIAPVIVSARTGKLLDGHARIEETLTKDEDAPVPFVKVDVTEGEERLILASFDPITAQATYDKEALDLLLREVSTGEAALMELLSDLAQKECLAYSQDDVDTSPVLSGLEYRVVVQCRDESHQSELLSKFEREGLKCQALIS